jgi:hypothetical protein
LAIISERITIAFGLRIDELYVFASSLLSKNISNVTTNISINVIISGHNCGSSTTAEWSIQLLTLIAVYQRTSANMEHTKGSESVHQLEVISCEFAGLPHLEDTIMNQHNQSNNPIMKAS